MKIAIINGNAQYKALFQSLGHEIVSLIQAQAVVFTGGADVTPALYGDSKHPFTGNDPARDNAEQMVFEQAIIMGIPMVGICRGAQFLNVMSGGRMYQHVEKHTRAHSITDVETGEVVFVSSTHHQMMLPSPDALLVATAALGGERQWFDGQVAKKDISKEDIEVVYYKDTNCLCFQAHPEFNTPEYEGMKQYFKRCLSKYLGVK